ncbi:MAG TPA: CDP-alcohol phosphatidyltransferase family protein [Chthoniobacterales bacterium]
MTLANQITILRIGLIPIFAALARAYGRSVQAGAPDEKLRRLAACTFLVAAVSDGLDGFAARRLNQKSVLGTILDPIADKGLMLVALALLGLAPWNRQVPRWYPVLVISRDTVLGIGYWLLRRNRVHVQVQPSPIGKMATVFQLLSVLEVLLRTGRMSVPGLVRVASLLTAASGFGYVYDGITQARH